MRVKAEAEVRIKAEGHPSRRWAGALLAVLFAVAACGGSSHKKPMVADNSDAPKTEEEDGGFGGAFSADGGGGGGGDTPPAAGGGEAQQGDEAGAQTLLKQFVAPNADHAALTKALRPTSDDYKALFDAATASKVEAAQAKDWDSGKAVIKPKPNQTEVKIWSASGADLAAGKGNAKEFPGGYKKVGKHLSAAVLFFRFKFVEAGKDQGTAYDGLAFVNKHWVIAPKPWKAIEAGKGGEDEGGGDNGGGDTPPPKPKKKGGKKKK